MATFKNIYKVYSITCRDNNVKKIGSENSKQRTTLIWLKYLHGEKPENNKPNVKGSYL